MRYKSIIRSLAATLITFGSLTGGVNAAITVFPGSSYDSNETTMNSTLGITSFTIEDFEDTTLIDGLSITEVLYQGLDKWLSNQIW